MDAKMVILSLKDILLQSNKYYSMATSIKQILKRYSQDERTKDEKEKEYHQSLGSLFLSIITLIANKDKQLRINTQQFEEKREQILNTESQLKKQSPEIIKLAFGHHVNHLFQTKGGLFKILSEIQSQANKDTKTILISSTISSSSQATHNSNHSHIYGNLTLEHSFLQKKRQQTKQWSEYCERLKKYLTTILNPKDFIELFCKLNGGLFETYQEENNIIARIQMNYIFNQPKIYRQQALFRTQECNYKQNAEKQAILKLLYQIFALHPQLFQLFCIEVRRQCHQIKFDANLSSQNIIQEIFDIQIDRGSIINEFNKFRDEFIKERQKKSTFCEDLDLIKLHFSVSSKDSQRFKVFDFTTVQQQTTNQGVISRIELTYNYDCEHNVFEKKTTIKMFPENELKLKLKKIGQRLTKQEIVQYIYRNFDFTILKITIQEKIKQIKKQND